MVKQIQQIAEANPFGFTINLHTSESPKTGYVVAYAETQDSFGMQGLEYCIAHALKHDGFIGGWLNEENGDYYFDSVAVIQDRAEAIALGVANEQLAIFHLDEMEVITL